MATTKFIYREQKENSNGEAPLYLRIYHAGKERQKKTDIYLKREHWDEDNQRIRKSHPTPQKLKLHLDRWKMRAMQAIQDAEPLTADNIKYRLEGVNPESYFTYVDNILDSFSYDYQKLIKSATNHLREFAPDLTLSGVTVSLLKSFERNLLKNVSQNSASQYLSIVRRILNRAIDDELISPNDSPFSRGQFKMSWEETDPTPLSWKDFIKLRDYETTNPKMKVCKDMFLFSVYMDGMRLTDVLTFRTKYIIDGISDYTMSKTGKKKRVKIVPAAREIIDDYKGGHYLFPLLNPKLKGDNRKEEIHRITGMLWHRVKKLGKLAGLKTPLHFHMARNTAAFIAYKKGEWTLVEIQNMLQHSSIQQTRNYLGRMAPEDIDEKRDQLWE